MTDPITQKIEPLPLITQMHQMRHNTARADDPTAVKLNELVEAHNQLRAEWEEYRNRKVYTIDIGQEWVNPPLDKEDK